MISLSEEQDDFYQFSINAAPGVYLLLAAAGCGKTETVKEASRELRRLGRPFLVCSTTNVSAILLSVKSDGAYRAQTIHSALFEAVEDNYENKDGKEIQKLTFRPKRHNERQVDFVITGGYLNVEAEDDGKRLWRQACEDAVNGIYNPLMIVSNFCEIQILKKSIVEQSFDGTTITIFVDECSMLDFDFLYYLKKFAERYRAAIILTGDNK